MTVQGPVKEQQSDRMSHRGWGGGWGGGQKFVLRGVLKGVRCNKAYKFGGAATSWRTGNRTDRGLFSYVYDSPLLVAESATEKTQTVFSVCLSACLLARLTA